MRVYLGTLGCRLNEAELETWGMDFSAAGHELVDTARGADLLVLNTCAVTAEAVRKSRKSIQRVQRENPTAKLVVSGCYVSIEEFDQTAAGIDLVVRNNDKDQLVARCQQAFDLDTMPSAATTPAAAALFQRHRQRAFIKIQDGCRYRCTFCIVTVARGDERSRQTKDIVDEINRLTAQGIQEVVLTGVHVGGYGSDLNTDLESLVRAILLDTDIPRVRFASVEPWDLPDQFFRLFENQRLMPHMHLPLQSGSDSVLRRMARRCKTQDFSQLVATIRQAVPHFNITTDIIVGFPGESDEEWQQTMDFVRQMDFGHIHVFSYSVRAGTKAARLPDQLPGNIKKQRSQALHDLALQSKLRVMDAAIGHTDTILWESAVTQSDQSAADTVRYTGYTSNYLRVETTAPASLSLENVITESAISGVNSAAAQLVADNHKIISQIQIPTPTALINTGTTIPIRPIPV
ncbi:MAG: tRNA (N(6)-L-threonylcarbamoyladenosine(37)-C(2))-methylthiotransferase MtaB [Gammaproteobacteria bacterium]|nr:tRNA (N(6)-L-threonylcarbamoyladenosine(37)-C(2))-methylthiotransferase MtaB [Gammaproteobacteria bacterium]